MTDNGNGTKKPEDDFSHLRECHGEKPNPEPQPPDDIQGSEPLDPELVAKGLVERQDATEVPALAAEPSIPKMKGVISEHERCPACTRNLYLKSENIILLNQMMGVCPECGCVFVPLVLRKKLLHHIKSKIIIPPTGFPGTGHRAGHG